MHDEDPWAGADRFIGWLIMGVLIALVLVVARGVWR